MKTILQSLLGLIVLLISVTNSAAVPVTWGTNGHMYEIVASVGADWNSARTSAQALGTGWDLATITSAGEQAFIVSLLGSPSTSSFRQYWIGGLQPPGANEPGGSWQWINGEGIFWDNGPVAGSYSNWGTNTVNEPNNVGPQNHVALDSFHGWGWDDNDNFLGTIIGGYVAEKAGGVSAVPEPSTFVLVATGLLGFVGYASWKRRYVGV